MQWADMESIQKGERARETTVPWRLCELVEHVADDR